MAWVRRLPSGGESFRVDFARLGCTLSLTLHSFRLNRGKGREITLKGERPVRIHVSAKHLLYPESYLQDSSSPSSNARYSSSTEQPLVNGPASSPSAKKTNAYVPKARFGSDRVDLKAIVDDAERQHLVHWED
jgi:hypothetical protein